MGKPENGSLLSILAMLAPISDVIQPLYYNEVSTNKSPTNLIQHHINPSTFSTASCLSFLLLQKKYFYAGRSV
jgi:hypothetical protein